MSPARQVLAASEYVHSATAKEVTEGAVISTITVLSEDVAVMPFDAVPTNASVVVPSENPERVNDHVSSEAGVAVEVLKLFEIVSVVDAMPENVTAVLFVRNTVAGERTSGAATGARVEDPDVLPEVESLVLDSSLLPPPPPPKPGW